MKEVEERLEKMSLDIQQLEALPQDAKQASRKDEIGILTTAVYIQKRMCPKGHVLFALGRLVIKKSAGERDYMSQLSEELASILEEFVATVQQISDASQNVAINEQKASEQIEVAGNIVEDITDVAQSVLTTSQNQADLATGLNDLVKRFKVEK